MTPAGALAELASDPDRAARLGKAAAEDVRARFDPARMAREVEAAHEGVLGRQPGQP